MSIATKLQTIYDGIEDVRDALQELDTDLGRGSISTLGDNIRTLSAGGSGVGIKIYGDVRSEEEVEVEDPETGETTTETEYTYTNSIILDGSITAKGYEITTDVIDGIGELDGDMVSLPGGLLEIPLNTGIKLTVNPGKVYVTFRDPVVENIVVTNWGVDGKITLAQVRAIKTLSTYFRGTAIETFNEFKWFDGLNYNPGTGANTKNDMYPFSGCTSLREIKLPRVHSLGNGAFCNCSSLTKIEIPDSFTDLGKGYSYDNSYFKNTQIEEIIIPSSVTTTSLDCFSGMPKLKRIVWGDNLPFPRTFPASDGYPYAFICNCPNLEKIENITTVNEGGCNVRLYNCPKLDCSNFWQMACQNQVQINTWSIREWYAETLFFEASPNSVYTFSSVAPNNTANNNAAYLWLNSLSEGGYVIELPNWTVNPYVVRAGSRVGKIVFSENVSSLGGQFVYETGAPEIILPCTTPPTFSDTNTIACPAVCRILVPENSLSLYLADEKWSTAANKLRAYRDPANAAATFCSIPSIASVPSDYTKVDYISNIDGDTTKNCQINGIGYTPKQYSQILVDFSHKWISSNDYSNRLFGTDSNQFTIYLSSVANDKNPAVGRPGGSDNPMGVVLEQRWFFNSKITGEKFGQRSTLKLNNKWIEYHGIAHQIDEATGDATTPLRLFRYDGTRGMQTRQVKLYRMCMFEPITGCTDYDDPTQYEIVRDYVPVMRNSDGVYGLYERLTDTFYSSTTSTAPFSGPAYE